MTPEKAQRLSELMRKAQAGDGSNYETLLMEVAVEVRAFAKRRIGRPESAEEVVQETLISVHKARHTYRSEMSFGPWLYAIAQRRLVDYFRKAGRSQELTHDGRVDNIAVPELDGPTEVGANLIEALSELPSMQREVIEMLKIQDLSVKEVASRLGMSESNVKVTAHRGYEILRQKFGVDGNAN